MKLTAGVSLVVLMVSAYTVILQRNILIDPGLENVMKKIISEFTYDDGNSEISYKDCTNVNMIWNWVEHYCDSLYTDQKPTESWSTVDITNPSNLVPVPMSFKAIQSVNVISAVYIGRAQVIPKDAKTLRGGINGYKWDKDWIDDKTHTQYRLFLLENNEPEEDANYKSQIEQASKEPHSQFFFLNSISKNKTRAVLDGLQEINWINEENTDTIFFKINIINANLARLAQVLVVWDRDPTGTFESFVVTSTAPDDGFYPDWKSMDNNDMMRIFFELLSVLTIVILIVYKIGELLGRENFNLFDIFFDLEIYCIISMIYHCYVWYQINDASDKYRARLGAPYKGMVLTPDQQFLTKSIMKSLYQGCEIVGKLCPGTVFGILNGTSPFRLTFIRSGIIMMFLYCVLIFDRIPKNSSFALLPNILRKTAPELLRIGLLLFLLFSVYAAVGTLLFGHSMSGFLTLSASFQTCIEMALGNDIELEDIVSEFVDNKIVRDSNSIVPIMLLPILYKWSFMILMTFILINIFVAIVTNAYDVVREEQGDDKDDWFNVMGERIKKVANVLWELTRPKKKIPKMKKL
ncbi:hypothetical protein AKO1_012803 [Acrasis kona]|uniref:Polycystin cation channel PKD1/PKD2 domain-containing protein n=1 Tax=Acrasis kona TaxID=1008807 RepID=A0AAW2YVX6_9EUKA